MNPNRNLQSIGGELGFEGVEHLVARAEAICDCEERRIMLTNEARIVGLQAEIASLAERENDLQERRRRAAPPGDERRRRRKVWYYRAVAFFLTLAGFFFSLVAFAPYRLGSKSYLYCLGIAIVTPFISERFLEEWASRHLVRALVSAAFLAAIVSLALLAVIRGDLFFEQAKATESQVIVEGEPSSPAPPETNFYDRTLSLLRIVMGLLAVAMEISAGLALREALKLGGGSGESRNELSRELQIVRTEMVVRLQEFTMLKNEAAIFAAQFWRDFYRSMLTRAMRNAVTRLVVFILAMFLLGASYAHAQNHPQFVLALDLTKSTATKGPDGETDFQKNLGGISRLLMTLPAGASITVIGITNRSFAQPLILLRAHVPDDPGYFGEQLQSGRGQIERAWQAKAVRLVPRFEYTDVLGSLILAGQIFENRPGSEKILVIFSDMRHHTLELNLESSSKMAAWSRNQAMQEIPVADLKDVRVYALGVDGAVRDFAYWEGLQQFWIAYFRRVGAHLNAYSVLRVEHLRFENASGR
jgi:hypothetical protein